jgi:hypothetical protein
MSPSHAPSSRRAFLAAAAGAAVVTAASVIDPRSVVRAGVDGDVVLGALNTATTTTALRITTNALDVLTVRGLSEKAAIVGANDDVGAGVRGEATSGAGVLGVSTSGTGVEGSTTMGNGVLGVSEEGTGVAGHVTLSGSGVHGHSFAAAGVGVRASAEAGRALVVSGKASFSRSGRATIPAGAAYVDVDLRTRGGLSGTPLSFANLTTRRPGVHVETVRPNTPSVGKLRIYLNKAVPGSTYVAWVVLG